MTNKEMLINILKDEEYGTEDISYFILSSVINKNIFNELKERFGTTGHEIKKYSDWLDKIIS